MSFQAIYGLSSQAMFTQDIRMNVVAGNLVNANVAAGSEQDVYKARDVLLSPSRLETSTSGPGAAGTFGVMVTDIVSSSKPPNIRIQPGHPLADDQDRVFYPAIDTVEQMADMMSASRHFETAVSLFATGRNMQDRVIELVNL